MTGCWSLTTIVLPLVCLLASACGSIRDKFDHDRGKAVQFNRDPLAPENLYAFDLIGFRWQNLPVKFQIESQFSERQASAIRAAAQIWNEGAGIDLLEILPSPIDVETVGLYELLGDEVNTIALRENWRSTGKHPFVLGTTIWDLDQTDKRRVMQSDIAINGQNYIPDDVLVVEPTEDQIVIDLQTLMIHEFGHALGLGHVDIRDDRDSIMNESILIDNEASISSEARGWCVSTKVGL